MQIEDVVTHLIDAGTFTHLEVAGRVQKQIARFQIAVEDVCGVNVLQSAQYLVEEVADVFVTQLLRLQKLVHVGFHEALNYVANTASRKCNNNSLFSIG